MTRGEFFRRIFSVDDEAGLRLWYHYTRALCYPNYKRCLLFSEQAFHRKRTAAKVLSHLFIWSHTSEGHDYWETLHNNLEDAKL